MKHFFHSHFTLFAMVLLFLFTISQLAGEKIYKPAAKVGKVKGLDDLGCKNGFIDIKGDCWQCPSGYKHDNIFLPPTDEKVCKKEGGRDKREGEKHKKATGILKTDCPKGQWWSSHNGYCYSCKSGYKHDPTKMGNKDGVCYKDSSDKYSSADKMKGSVFCEEKNAFPDPNGSCYKCPANFVRNPTPSKVDGPEACVSTSCGALNDRPCLLTERIPSCDKGLAEDFIANQCVPDISEQVCIAAVKAVSSGELPDSLKKMLEPYLTKVKQDSPGKGNKNLYNKYLSGASKSVQPYLTPLNEFNKLMKSQLGALKDSFAAETICSPTRLKAKIKNMMTPKFEGQFFTSQSFSVAASAIGGVQIGIMYVTDWKNQAGVYIFVGGQLAPLTVGAGASIAIQFYPGTTLAGFEGFGYGVGAAVGTPMIDASVGIDFAYPFPFDPSQLIPIGYGINLGTGVNAIPTPVDGSIALTYTWKLWSTSK